MIATFLRCSTIGPPMSLRVIFDEFGLPCHVGSPLDCYRDSDFAAEGPMARV